ncbi:MAG TPA: hypothetical protein VJ553_02845 [Candidatus Paceibacterota bacterium]|nr:hypothetical protein [Candidatus Paceibacterota bacterium]
MKMTILVGIGAVLVALAIIGGNALAELGKRKKLTFHQQFLLCSIAAILLALVTVHVMAKVAAQM